MEILDETQGLGQETEDVSEERSAKHLRARRNVQVNHKHTNHSKNTNHIHTQSQSKPQTQTLNTGQNSYTQIPKPPQKPRSPKNNHARTTEGIFIVFYFNF